MSDFTSNNNKGVIWNLLTEFGFFKNIPSDKFSTVQTIFESTIADTDKMNNTVIEKNKIVISKLASSLDSLRMPAEPAKNVVTPHRVTAQEISDERREQFGKGVVERQKDFDSLMHAAKPGKIDFSDKENRDKPIGGDMDKLVSEALARRETELSRVMSSHDQTAAEEWLSNGGAAPVKLKIGEEISQDRKVMFNDESEIIPNPAIDGSNDAEIRPTEGSDTSDATKNNVIDLFANFKTKKRDLNVIMSELQGATHAAFSSLEQIDKLIAEVKDL